MKKTDAPKKSKQVKKQKSRILLMMSQFRPAPANPLLNAILMVIKMVEARKKGARLIAFGETALQGYSIFDELKNPDFYHQSTDAIKIIKYAANKLKIGIILGYYRQNIRQSEKWANNSLLCYIPPDIPNLEPQEYSQDKVLIPFEKEIKEGLYVQEGKLENLGLVKLGPLTVGFNICQDSWQALSQIRSFKYNPVKQVVEQKPDIFINLSSSPFYMGKTDDTIYSILSKISRENNLPILYLGIVGLDGGQLVLGGYSQVLYNGQIYHHMKMFQEQDLLIDLTKLDQLPKTRKPQAIFSSRSQRKKHHFNIMNNAFNAVFHYLCLKHAIIDLDINLDDEKYASCFENLDLIKNYLEILRRDDGLYAKKGFVFHFDGRSPSILLAHVLHVALKPEVTVAVIVTENANITKMMLRLLKSYQFNIIQIPENELVNTMSEMQNDRGLVALDTFSFSDYMVGTVPKLIFGLAPLGSLSLSLIYELIEDYGLMKYTTITPQDIDDQLVIDIMLQSFLQNGKDFRSVLLKSFPTYFDYQTRFGQISNIAESFLEYLLSLYKKYHNAMNNISHRINEKSIIQLTWYSPNRFNYVNHSLSVSDWYIRQAFENIRPQLENW